MNSKAFVLIGVLTFAGGALAGRLREQPADAPAATRTETAAVSTNGSSRAPAAVQSTSLSADPLGHIRLSGAEQRILGLLPKSAAGEKLRRALIASYHPDEMPDAEAFGEKIIEELRQTPDESYQALSDLRKQLPTNANFKERATLLMAMATMPGHQAEANALARHDMTTALIKARPLPASDSDTAGMQTALTTSEDMLVPLSAHGVFLGTATNPQESLAGTKAAIMAQSDPFTITLITRQFLSLHPEMSEDIAQVLTQRFGSGGAQ